MHWFVIFAFSGKIRLRDKVITVLIFFFLLYVWLMKTKGKVKILNLPIFRCETGRSASSPYSCFSFFFLLLLFCEKDNISLI